MIQTTDIDDKMHTLSGYVLVILLAWLILLHLAYIIGFSVYTINGSQLTATIFTKVPVILAQEHGLHCVVREVQDIMTTQGLDTFGNQYH